MSPDSKQIFDENGNQIQRGAFRDISGSVRNIKDGLSFFKGAIASHGIVAAGYRGITNALKGSNKKILQTVGKGLAGESGGLVGMIGKFLNKAFIDLPGWITAKMIESPRLSKIIGGDGILKELELDSFSF